MKTSIKKAHQANNIADLIIYRLYKRMEGFDEDDYKRVDRLFARLEKKLLSINNSKILITQFWTAERCWINNEDIECRAELTRLKSLLKPFF